MSNVNELAKALNEFQAEVVTVSKDANNPFFKSKYAPLESIMKAALPVLTKHGLAVTQLIDNIDGNSALTTVLMHVSGQEIRSTMPLILAKEDPQGQGSAITYARRYSYASILGLVIDEDDDGNRATVAVDTGTRHYPEKKVPLQGEATDKQKETIAKCLQQEGVALEDQKDFLIEQFGVEFPLTKQIASEVIDALFAGSPAK